MSFFCPGFSISCFGTTCFSGALWSGLAFLILGPHAFPGRCGLALRFLSWDHMFFRSAVVWLCASYFGTTYFSGALWSDLALLTLGPHTFPERCGLILLFLSWDHTLFRSTVVWSCASYFGTTSVPAILISPSTALPLYSFWPVTAHGPLRSSLYAAFCVILGWV